MHRKPSQKAKSLVCLMLAFAMAQAAPLARYAYAQNDDLDRLFDDEDELNEPPAGTFQAPPPPPAPPPMGGAQDFNPPPAGFPTDNGGSGKFPTPQGAPKTITKAPMKAPLKKPDSKKPSMADANIEDITNENYPDLIESFDYPNAEITDVIKAMSQLTGKNFIIDPTVRGKISIIAPSQITMAEAWKAFLAALAVNQFTVVPYGKFLKVKSTRNAQRDSIETYSGKYYPNSDILITRIVHLKHISADEVNKRLRILPSKDGEMTPYEPTNSLIITDFGSNVERIMKIINELDRPGFEEQLAVVPIRYAKAKELADLINQIINKEPSRGGGFGGPPGAPAFGAGVPRFRSRGGQPGSGVPEELSLVAPDDRTNALIVVGNKAGIEKVRTLVRKLDYKLNPAEAGGVFVYYCRFAEAEKIAQTLSGITSGGAGGAAGAGGPGGAQGGFGRGGFSNSPLNSQSIFGGDVKITADKNTNSLVITASYQDYQQVLTILAKLDIQKDQVFVEAIIMELNSQKQKNWNPNYYGFAGDPNGIGRRGFITSPIKDTIMNPLGDSGVVLGFGSQSTVELNLGGSKIVVPNLLAFLNIIQQNTEANILSTPRILAQDNEPAEIEVGDKIPIGTTSTTTTTGTTSEPKTEDASIKLKVTPFIRPDSNVVRLIVDQTVKQKAKQNVAAETLAKTTVTISNRSLKTNITVHSGDTAVLGGLVRDDEQITEKKVPLLGDIPVLGWLFKSRNIETSKINLVIFLTPKIIRSLADGHKNLSQITNERIDWIKKNYDGRDPYGKKVDGLPRQEQEQARAEAEQMPGTKTNNPPPARKK